MNKRIVIIAGTLFVVLLGTLAFSYLNIALSGASSSIFELYVNSFDNTRNGWTKYGSTPYLSSSDILNYVRAGLNDIDDFNSEWYRYAGNGNPNRFNKIYDVATGNPDPSMKMDAEFVGTEGTGIVFVFTQVKTKGGSELAIETDFRAKSNTYLSSVTNAYLYVFKNESLTPSSVLWWHALAAGGTKDTGWQSSEQFTTGTNSDSTVKIGFGGSDAWGTNWGQLRWFDNIRVRKHVDAQMHGSWGQQEPQDSTEYWGYRKSHMINSASNAGTKYQVRIICHYGDDTDDGEDVYLNGHCQPDFDDIRFTDDDGVTFLDYWMEEKVNGDYAVFWVEVQDDLSSQDAKIYLYYGNDAVSSASNGADTFLLFYNFDNPNNMETGNYGFQDSGKSMEAVNSVTLGIYCQYESDGDDKIQPYIYDGATWTQLQSITPHSHGTSYAWKELDVSSVLNTWWKIDYAKLYMVYEQVGSTAECIDVDAAKLIVDYSLDSVTTDKIADGAVTADKIADGAVTSSKLSTEAIPLGIAHEVLPATTRSTSWTDMPGMLVTVTLQRTSHLLVLFNAEINAWDTSVLASARVDEDFMDPIVAAIGGDADPHVTVCNFFKLSVAPGTHTVKIEWRLYTEGSATSGIRSLIVMALPA